MPERPKIRLKPNCFVSFAFHRMIESNLNNSFSLEKALEIVKKQGYELTEECKKEFKENGIEI